MTAFRKRVLVSESNQALRSILTTALQHEDLDVDCADGDIPTLLKLGECDYAVLLVELTETTASMLRTYRENRPQSTTFIVGLSSGESFNLTPNLLHAYVEKPVEIGFFARLIRDCAAVVQLPEQPLDCPSPENPSKRVVNGDTRLAN
jgi:DNA-binding response OmpR family regulator